MKALIYEGKDKLAVKDRPVPTLEAEEVLIEVKYAGICGTDLSIVAGQHPRAQPGLIMGHEFSGVITEIKGSSRPDLAVGDRVVAEPLISCGKCYACKAGFAYVCQYLGLYGIDADGAFANSVKVAADKVFKIPDNVSFEIGALIEPIAVAVHSVRLSCAKAADSVVVLGGGPIGLLTALTASTLGLKDVVLCELQPYRVNLAREFGLHTIDIKEKDPLEEINRITDGRGADIVFEVAGAQASITLAPKLCRVRGELIQIAMPKTVREVNMVDITFKELTLKGVRVYDPFDFERALHIVSRSQYDFGKLLSKPYTLDQAEEAFQVAKQGQDVMKVLFAVE